ncbi:bifunctional adenosylcobinamide kinase/adenosylcobinamide-phosphate guanylyltransferase [Aquibium sp. A9E412]|uniref:bifunctional adenosylcobinamide kinase/adenosylcobinamide-phosphate guanylyltransferase n=1 Tax=Aquibium sp. A9E412 TaxID=2976767 RepID=UPI0025B274B9|nr:bifunctional adenosylcobinamide kinase/adenosylcobinamide-phosphate guanylyltransferase [Aquibium sp. A9E412]MDN2565859.1 bifunctional adenosylcobinamide kinase/adenosylcobinamide-phosphate guanylyltransferase [Aquibium sp. A9E412]
MAEAGRLTLLLGGARSGKSAHAERLVAAHPGRWRYIATGQAHDAEMADRIAEHRARRGAGWHTVEAPLDLAAALAEAPPGEAVLVDCLTLWLSNHLIAGSDLAAECDRLAAALAAPIGPWYAVSNEVGLGIVPDNALSRRFRDAAGRLHQQVARTADSVLFMVAGLPMTVK